MTHRASPRTSPECPRVTSGPQTSCLRACSANRRERSLIDAIAAQVAGARSLLQARCVEDRNCSAAIVDQIPSMQGTRSVSHARPPYPEHVGKKLMGEVEAIATHAF